MAKLLYRMGSFIAKHKWASLFAWIILLAVIIGALTVNAPKFDDDITMNGLKSLDTNDKISKEFHQDSQKAKMRLVFHSDKDNGITDKSTKKDIQKALNNIKQDDDYIQNVSDPYDSGQINKDKDTAIADINYVVSQTNMQDQSKKIIDKELSDVKDDHNLKIEKTSQMSMQTDTGSTSEIVGIIAAFIILLITFGSIIAAGMPIVSALIGLGTSVGIIGILTYVFDIPNFTLTLAVMIGLAVGIDYSLFILFRYKEIAQKGKGTVESIGLAVGTAGSAVIFAGLTVMVAVCGLSLVGIDFLAVMGFASAISVLFAVLAALTLLPALISIFHKRIKLTRKKGQQARATNVKEDSNKSTQDQGNGWGRFIVGKPIIAAVIGIVILLIALIPVTHMRLGMPDDSLKPQDSPEHKAYKMVSDNFGEGYNGQIVMLVNTKDGGSKKDIENNLDNIRDDIKDLDHVDKVQKAHLNDNNHYALISVIPDDGPNAKSTQDLTYELRDYHSQAKEKYDFDTEISGQSVINIDMSEKLNNAIPVFAGVIVAIAFVLLLFVFRSILVPLKAVLGFVISLAATLGFTTLVMQDGFLGGLFGVDATGPVLAFLPVIVIGILFGLAIDYELFLMTRVHEEYSKTGDNDRAILVGIKQSGPVIVAAALIMFSVFISFVFQDDTTIKSVGIALGFGVLFDAFIVRMMIIPALTKLFGKAAWYLPKWLDSILPKIDVEGKALEEEDSDSTDEEANKNYNQAHTEHPTSNHPDYDRAHADSYTPAYTTYESNQPEQRYTDHDNLTRDYTNQTHASNFGSDYRYQDIDYERLYTQEGGDIDSHEHATQYDKQEPTEDENKRKIEKTTALYEALAKESKDQDIVFNALMLYARVNHKDIYDEYKKNHTSNGYGELD
ncbi:MMPL family transporter [Staphylococcus sp. SQ8-PEA]|uniref:MMPL family transporter n=1 Tax=Staphylococcus marylandisciuri TaxID=2981529 RepID=A0ABT2QSF5_9STAP|nr:MMPL family transporter [Staphylococcus marylandisciuri]MCU5746928.1 MMPL family transporter [Staphylococcus marylandisciuri]